MRVMWIIKFKIPMTRTVLLLITKARSVQVKQLKSPKNSNNKNSRIYFKDILKDHNIGSILIPTGYNITLWQWSLNVSKGYIVNIFQVSPINIGLHFILKLGPLKQIQVQLYPDAPTLAYMQHVQTFFLRNPTFWFCIV